MTGVSANPNTEREEAHLAATWEMTETVMLEFVPFQAVLEDGRFVTREDRIAALRWLRTDRDLLARALRLASEEIAMRRWIPPRPVAPLIVDAVVSELLREAGKT